MTVSPGRRPFLPGSLPPATPYLIALKWSEKTEGASIQQTTRRGHESYSKCQHFISRNASKVAKNTARKAVVLLNVQSAEGRVLLLYCSC